MTKRSAFRYFKTSPEIIRLRSPAARERRLVLLEEPHVAPQWEIPVIRMKFSKFWTVAQLRSQTVARTAAMLAVAGCASTQSPDDRAATLPIAPAAPSATVSAIPDATGIVTYDGYQAATARSGDTVAIVAHRIGMSASELGAYNGLSPTYPLQAGDEMVLPPSYGGDSARAPDSVPLDTSAEASITDAGVVQSAPSNGARWSPDLAAAAIEQAATFDNQSNRAVPPSTEQSLLTEPQVSAEPTSPQLRKYQTREPEPIWTLAADPYPIQPVTPFEE